jgi:hypothetical protein
MLLFKLDCSRCSPAAPMPRIRAVGSWHVDIRPTATWG